MKNLSKYLILLTFSAIFISAITGLPTLAVGLVLFALHLFGAFSKIPENSLLITDYTGQLLRKVILDHSKLDMSKGQQAFEMRESDVAILRYYYQDTLRTLTPNDVATIENTRNSNQTVDIYLQNKIAPGVGNTHVRIGTGDDEPVTVVPTYFDWIEEGMDISYTNQKVRQFMNEGADRVEATRMAYESKIRHLFPQKARNIYTRMNAQYAGHLEANKWALNSTPDLGQIYTTYVGDTKQIPAAATPSGWIQIIQNMKIEARRNNFLQLGRPVLIVSPEWDRVINEYLARGQQQAQDVSQFLNWFDYVVDNEIPTDVADIGTCYMVAAGGLAAYNQSADWTAHPDYENGKVTYGQDSWSNITIGGEDTMIFNNLPMLNIGLKQYGGYADNSGVIAGNPDEAKIDIGNHWSFVTRGGALRAYDQVPDVSPIIKYVLKAA